MTVTRRRFLHRTAAGGTLIGMGELGFLSRLRPVTAAEANLQGRIVPLPEQIEPLVRLLEETPRAELIEVVAHRVRAGLAYRDVLAALLLAGVRNVEPRPSVGFKFHAVLVVNSAHLASLSSPDEDRWLPIFWALDYFKSAQARDVREGNWTMAPVDEAAVPAPDQALDQFIRAMDRWDESAADAAVAGLARAGGANRLFDVFVPYAARDFRSIGHKAIFLANSWRTLNCIGWQHAEPVLRSLAYALLNHQGEPNPADSDLDADRPGRRNAELVHQIPATWQAGRVDRGATTQLLQLLREASPADASHEVVRMLQAGVSAQSVYDALFLGAGELLMRQPGIVALHAVTSTNALYFVCRHSGDESARKFALLQNAAFLPLFRQAMLGRGRVGDAKLDELQAEPPAPRDQPLDQVFHQISHDRAAAARSLLSCLQQGTSPEDVIRQARRLVFLKGDDSHDYKFSSAVLEDYYHVSPEWRDRFLSASVFKLRGAEDRGNQLVERIRHALA